MGRFITPDSIVPRPGNPQEFNRYSYALNNPVNRIDPSGHKSWWKKFWGHVVSAVAGIVTTIATGGNFVLGFQVYSLTNTAIGAGQALANGANPGRVFGSLAAGIALGLAGAGLGIGDIGNLGLRMGAFAVQGAAIGAANAAIMGTNIGEGAAWGAGFGAVTGFVTSQQVANWRENGQFMSNSEYAAQQAKINNMLDPVGDRVGEFGLASTSGHTGMVLTDYQSNQVDFFGKYPGIGAKESAWFFGKTTQGVVNNEFGMPQLTNSFASPTYAGWRINRMQYNALNSYRQNPGTFALTTNCAEFALRGARYIGINTPSNLTTFGFTDPRKVGGWLSGVSSYGAGL